MEARQLLRRVATAIMARAEATAPLIGSTVRNCSPVNLPAGGILSLPNGDTITLTAGAAFRQACTIASSPAIIANGGGTVTMSETSTDSALADTAGEVSDFFEHFYASIFPQCYALAATTIVAYTLVIMLFITPRSFLDGGVVVLGRKGFTNGGNGANIGGRPWLQKVAALTVAISLTIATAATFRVAEDHYSFGYINAKALQEDVLGGNELKIIRIISDTFLWLAQAQTLIRLFPRQREKVIIKWTAFALISLDVIFQSLNSFQYMNQGSTRPRSFTDAVPALSYLFELALGVLYAAWVIYYSLMKKRYAFYHPQMKNICLVAGLSLLSILVPVVFFILDISKPDFTGWGDYVRWVGAAAASVIVWEWVERIEALEREEKKDGILGREVFDGDEMMELTSSDFTWPRKRRKEQDDGDGESGRTGRDTGSTTARGTLWPSVTSVTSRYRSRSRSRKADRPGEPATTLATNNDRIRFSQPPLWPARPAPAVTPVSRTDTASAASTVYAIRYHPLTETTTRTTPPPLPLTQDNRRLSRSESAASSRRRDDRSPSTGPEPATLEPPQEPREASESAPSEARWRSLARAIPRPRISRGDETRIPDEDKTQQDGKVPHYETGLWDIRNRLEEFAMTQAERLRERIRPTPDTDSLPVTVIPAPPRTGAALVQLREDEELDLQRRGSDGPSRSSPSASTETAASLTSWQLHRANSSGPIPPHMRLSPIVTHSSSLAGRRNVHLPVTVIPAPARRDVATASASASTSASVYPRQGGRSLSASSRGMTRPRQHLNDVGNVHVCIV